MKNRWSRRTFISAVGASAALVSCAGSLPTAPPKGAPREGEIKLPPGGFVGRRRLGRTGIEVSMIGLGGHHIGRPKEESEGIHLIRMALENGVDFLDNCWDYHGGESERRMGKALRDGYRQKAFVMTKIDGRTRAAAAAQLEQSLRRLQTD